MLWLVICHRYITIDSINFGQLKMSFLCFIVHLVCGTNAINEINLLFDLDSSYSIWLKSEWECYLCMLVLKKELMWSIVINYNVWLYLPFKHLHSYILSYFFFFFCFSQFLTDICRLQWVISGGGAVGSGQARYGFTPGRPEGTQSMCWQHTLNCCPLREPAGAGPAPHRPGLTSATFGWEMFVRHCTITFPSCNKLMSNNTFCNTRATSKSEWTLFEPKMPTKWTCGYLAFFCMWISWGGLSVFRLIRSRRCLLRFCKGSLSFLVLLLLSCSPWVVWLLLSPIKCTLSGRSFLPGFMLLQSFDSNASDHWVKYCLSVCFARQQVNVSCEL